MHLVFLGLVKTVFKGMLAPFLKRRHSSKLFDEKIESVFTAMADLNLEWLKLMPWAEAKTGGLCSENFSGFARVAPYIGDLLRAIVVPPEPSPPTELDITAIDKWLLTDCTQWLKERDLFNAKAKRAHWVQIGEKDTSKKMNKPELVAWIKHLCEREEGIPPVVKFWTVPTELVSCLLASLSSTVSQLMMKTVSKEKCDKAFVETQIFLNLAALLVTASSREDMKNVEGSKMLTPNFYSALNLSREVLKKFGSGRVLWEGGPQGEGAVKKIRTQLTQNKKSTALMHAHSNLLERLTLDHMEDSVLGHTDNIATKQTVKNYHSYTPAALAEAMASHNVLSGVVLRKGPFGFMVKTGHNTVQFKRAVVSQPAKSKTGVVYWNVTAATSMDIVRDNDILMYCVLLPDFGCNGLSKNGWYNIRSSERQELQMISEQALWKVPSCQKNAWVQSTVLDVVDKLDNLDPLKTGTDKEDNAILESDTGTDTAPNASEEEDDCLNLFNGFITE
jgi:hypothetical protein